MASSILHDADAAGHTLTSSTKGSDANLQCTATEKPLGCLLVTRAMRLSPPPQLQSCREEMLGRERERGSARIPHH
ncbi:hypothetical protein BRADI_3g22140v3 [Brachypodium distachyon]|uniref:Uncharacterized protein n=1 Tax=Brachypodium distachyon TaxID=15368 RepID=A0A0Q3Q3P5_BRADI|nr:hypothetical protein BRADI_3g22140v3 [Brachypodium distachyon]